MSVEAISWALNLAPVPADRGGQPSSACKFVLVGLANHAKPDGTGAFPSAATLVRYTGLAERTVRTCLDRLQAQGVIRPCDPGIVTEVKGSPTSSAAAPASTLGAGSLPAQASEILPTFPAFYDATVIPKS